MVTITNLDRLQVVDFVAREKNLPKEQVLAAMESAIESASKKKYGHEHAIKATIDRKNGDIKIFRVMKVVETVDNYFNEMALEAAKVKNPDVKLGDELLEPLPPIDLGRVAVQAAKQMLIKKVSEAEKEREYEEYKDRVGDIISGTVKRIEKQHGTEKQVIVVNIARAEALLKGSNLVPGETFKTNDRIRVYIEEVKRADKGPQIILSRVHKDFLVKLFMQEVPEIYEGLIQVKAVARDPGSRAKIAVFSEDRAIDAVGSCVGVGGARVQAITHELKGERIDVIQWSSDPATFVINALTPAEVLKVVIDEARRRIEVIVASNNLSKAIGRRGQNVKLASQLLGWGIDILTEEEESTKRVAEFNMTTRAFMEALNIEEDMANLLAQEGFLTVEDIALTPVEEFTSIEGFDEDIATELQARAQEYLKSVKENNIKALEAKGVSLEVAKALNIDEELMLHLAEAGYKEVEDIAAADTNEIFTNVQTIHLSEEEINELIKRARAII